MEAFTERELSYNRTCELNGGGLQPVVPYNEERRLQQPDGVNSCGGEICPLDCSNGSPGSFPSFMTHTQSSTQSSLTRLISNDSEITRQTNININDNNIIGMTELFLCKTNMADIGLSSVASYLQHTTTLKVLSLSQCNLTDRHAILLAGSIYKNRHNLILESLFLSFNEFSDEGMKTLVGAVARLNNLKEFMVDNNMMGGRGAQVVSEALLAPASPSIETTTAYAATPPGRTAQMFPTNPHAVPITLSLPKPLLMFGALTKLDVGFNKISGSGMHALMKAVAHNRTLVSLSLSGNVIDTASAKAVAYVMAHNVALKSLYLDHCDIGAEGLRHVTAGIVSNCRTRLQTLTGFQVGFNAVSLGLPPALEHWTNEKVLRFILLMWEHSKLEQEERSVDKELDPLHLLPTVVQPGFHPTSGNNIINSITAPIHGAVSSTPNIIRTTSCVGPLDPATVVAVAKRAYASLHAQQPITDGVNGGGGLNVGDRGGRGLEAVGDALLRLQISSAVAREEREASFDSPVTEDAIILEANGEAVVESEDVERNHQHQHPLTQDENCCAGTSSHVDTNDPTLTTTTQIQTPPTPDDLIIRKTSPLTFLDLPARKKKIVEWVCGNIHHLNELSHAPFDSSELIKLYQHFFSPVIQDNWQPSNHHDNANGGNTLGHHARDDVNHGQQCPPSRTSAATQDGTALLSGPGGIIATNDLTRHTENQPSASNHDIPSSSTPVMGTLPMLKRKVSYRHLHEASAHSLSSHSQLNSTLQHNNTNFSTNVSAQKTRNERPSAISKLIEDQQSVGGNSMQPKSKRARRNRSRISFVPRFKAKLDSFLDSCHHKALILMRQLVYIEETLLNNEIYPLESLGTTQYLVGTLAADAEMILLDMV